MSQLVAFDIFAPVLSRAPRGLHWRHELRQNNDSFKKFEDVREAGAVIAAREWTSHDVESTIADVGPFPSIRTQGYHRIDARGAKRRKEAA